MTSTHKKPYEPLLIGSRKGSGPSLQRQKVLWTVPMVEHSRKPNLQSKYIYRCLKPVIVVLNLFHIAR